MRLESLVRSKPHLSVLVSRVSPLSPDELMYKVGVVCVFVVELGLWWFACLVYFVLSTQSEFYEFCSWYDVPGSYGTFWKVVCVEMWGGYMGGLSLGCVVTSPLIVGLSLGITWFLCGSAPHADEDLSEDEISISTVTVIEGLDMSNLTPQYPT